MATLPRTLGVQSLLLALATLGILVSRAWAESEPIGPDEPPSPEGIVLQNLMLFFAIIVIAVTWLRGKEVISTLVTVRLLGVAVVLGSTLILTFSNLEASRMMPVMVMLGVSLGLFFARTEESPATEGTSPTLSKVENAATKPTASATASASTPEPDGDDKQKAGA